jgi:hypothetical protein
MNNSTPKLPMLIVCLFGALALPALLMAVDGGWLKRVRRSRVFGRILWRMTRTRLLQARSYSNTTAQRAMARMRGRGSRPSLRSSRVHNATDGELEWLLTNGDLAHGMPSWSRLPEGERWQIVRYLHTLPVASCCLTPERLHG